MTLKLEEIVLSDKGEYSERYKVYFRFSMTPNVRYCAEISLSKKPGEDIPFSRVENEAKMLIESIARWFNNLSVFEASYGILVPIYVSWAGGSVDDKPKHHIWESDLAYITIEANAGTTNGWIGAILKFNINEKTLNKLVIKRVLKLWDKYVEEVEVDTCDIIHPYPMKFKTDVEVRKMTVESCWLSCSETEIEVKIPKGLLEDIDKTIKSLPMDKIKRIIERSIKEIDELEKKLREEGEKIEFIEEVIKKKKEIRENMLAKLHQDQLDIV